MKHKVIQGVAVLLLCLAFSFGSGTASASEKGWQAGWDEILPPTPSTDPRADVDEGRSGGARGDGLLPNDRENGDDPAKNEPNPPSAEEASAQNGEMSTTLSLFVVTMVGIAVVVSVFYLIPRRKPEYDHEPGDEHRQE